MRLKLYRARTMAEAMAQIRSQLGPEALILGCRRVGGGVEITAALEPEQAAASPPDTERIVQLEWHGVPAKLAVSLRAGSLESALASTLGFAPLPDANDAPPLLLVGPPGGGKTLTVARLATRHVLDGRTPLVITTDGQRAGAVEQLASYTRLLGLSLLVAENPVILGRALTRRQPGAPVLIDSPGADIFEPIQRSTLGALATASGATIVLVLPAGLDPAEAAETGACHAAEGASLLIPTRLDMARRLGSVLAAAHAGELSLTEAGIGPGATDGLVKLTPAFLAARLLASPATPVSTSRNSP